MEMTSKRTQKKREGVLICALTFLLCLTLTAVCFGSEPLAAKADGADMRTNLFASSTAVTADTNGVTVASGGTGKIKGIFKGTSSFKFSFGNVTNGSLGNFQLTVADAEDPTQSFTVVYHQQAYSTNIFVQYGNERRTSQAWATNDSYKWVNTKQYNDSYMQSAKFDGASVGELYIEKSGTAWQVKAKRQSDSNIVAAFDGTSSLVTDTSWGLPTLSFANGYTVSYSSAAWSDDGNAYVGAAVTWKEIGDTALTSEVTTAPQFYTDYKATVVAPQNLFTASTTVTADTNGVTVAKDNTVKINGIFTGDTTLKFALPQTDGSENNNIKITVADAEDPTKSFTVVYYKSNRYYTNVALLYNDNIYSTKYDDENNTWYNTFQAGETNISYGIGYGESFRENVGGSLAFAWHGDILTVSSTGQSNNMRKVAVFDGTKDFVSGTSWGLPKMNFSNGYTISFASTAWNAYSYSFSGASVTWKEIAGITLDGDDVTIPQFYKNKDIMPLFSVPAYESNVFAGKEVTIPDVQVKAGFDGTLASATSAKVKTVPSGSDIAADTAISGGKFTPDVPGDYTVEYTGLATPNAAVAQYNTRTIKFTATARTPVITLADEIASAVFVGSSGTIPSATARIENAEYDVYVSVKLSDSDILPETAATENKTVTFSQVGTYVVEYVTKETSPAITNAVETYQIVVTKPSPIITVTKDIATSGITGKTGVIPAATATISGAPCDVTVSVIFNETALENFANVSAAEDRSVTFHSAGTYTVVYYSIADGMETEETFYITVVDDDTDPVLTVGTPESTQVTMGTEVVIPTATAVDNADGDVAVSIKVWFGTEEVTVTDGKFTADKEGTYRIVFSASDSSNNSTDKEILIESKALGAGFPHKNNWWIILVAVLGSLIVAGAIAAVVIIVIRKKKQGVK